MSTLEFVHHKNNKKKKEKIKNFYIFLKMQQIYICLFKSDLVIYEEKEEIVIQSLNVCEE